MSQKIPKKFICENCDYFTDSKKDYNKHVSTDKHKKVTNSYINSYTKVAEYFSCECGKKYKHRQNLYVHKKKCNFKENNECNKDDIEIDNYSIKNTNDNKELKIMIELLVNENKELKAESRKIIEKQDILVNSLIDIAKEPKTINNNQKMTINMYLNDKCGDAIDFMKFIEDIQISRAQLMYTKENGLAKGVSNVIISGLKEMEETERPIHCTDKKRQQFYIKDGNWKKDNVENTMSKAVYGLSHKHFAELEVWDKDQIEQNKADKEEDLYLNIAKQCANTKDEAEKNAKRVMKDLSDKVELKI
jgi:hypothetical protein